MNTSVLDSRAARAISALFLIASLLLIAICSTSIERKSKAQIARPILLSEPTSTRAIALDSVTRVREPFAIESPVAFGPDNRTRIMLFALNLHVASGDLSELSADAEDGAGRVYPLKVEHAGKVTGQEWMTSIVLRLHEDLRDAGDVLVRVSFRGASSNRVRVGVGRIGGGPPDDLGALPTPAPAVPAPTPNANPVTAGNLSSSDVEKVLAQAVSAALVLGRNVTVAVTDREGNSLGVFKMTGAGASTLIQGGGTVGRGLEGLSVPSVLAAISKAGTASFFSTRGNAFNSRTASFIVQEHFPPRVDFRPAGPLFGVQFSQLPCSDIKRPALPLGLSADPGSVPLYKDGAAVGGVGIEGDGLYTLDKEPTDFDKPFEELIAVAAARGYEQPPLIRGDNILVDGIRLAYLNAEDEDAPRPPTLPFASLPGAIDPAYPIRAAQPSAFVPATVGGVRGEVDTRFFPFVGSSVPSPNSLTSSEVGQIIASAAQQAEVTRAAIRQPLGSKSRVSIAVVDAEGNVLGVFRTEDAPVFGFDVSVQKARTAAFMSNRNAGLLLRGAGLSSYVERAAADRLTLDGSIAFSDRAGGFLHRPFYPDGLNPNPAGPFSAEISEWSVFNTGLQLDLVKANLLAALGGADVRCSSIPNLANGMQIFPGSIPLYKNGEMVGGVGISGDGVDQDDLIAAAGANAFAPPVAIRADQFFVRGTRLPFLKFPRSPNL